MIVSVAIPTRNPKPAHLDALLSSLSRQEQPVREVIVFDDASDDNTAESITSHWVAVLPIKFMRHAKRVGMVANWNAAVRAGSGTHVLVAGQDEVLRPSFLKRVGAYANNDVAAVACANVYIDDNGLPVYPQLRVNHRLRLYPSPGAYRVPRDVMIELGLRNGNIIGEPACVLFRRDAFERVGGYDPFLEHAADLDLALRLLDTGVIVYLNENLVARRLHAAAESHTNIRSGAAARDRHRLYHRYSTRLTSHGDHRVRVSLAARASKDLLLGLRTRNRGLALLALRLAWQSVAPLPCGKALLELIMELISGQNADSRALQQYRC